jgi:hypothetical protein
LHQLHPPPQKSLNLALLIDQHLYPAQMTFFARSPLLWPSLGCRQGQIDDPPAEDSIDDFLMDHTRHWLTALRFPHSCIA